MIIAGVAMLLLFSAFFLFDDPEQQSAELLVQPELGPFQVSVTATGELRAKNSVNIYGPSRARQVQIYEMKILRLIPEGTVVTQGDFVAELDKSELHTKVQTAQIDLQKAQSQFTQTSLDTALTLSQARDDLVNLKYAMEEAQLRKEQSIYEPPTVQRQEEINYEKSERTFNQASKSYVTQVDQAIAKMQEVQAELSKAQNAHNDLMSIGDQFTILAPQNGMLIYDRDWRGNKTTVGGTVRAWDPVVATLPDLSVMKSITYVNEVDIQKVKVGQQVKIGLDADAERVLTGTVTDVANIGEQRPNSDAKVFQVEIEVNESDSTLRPAMTTSNTIVIAEMEEAMFLPLECIHATDSLTFVYTKEKGRLVRKEVKLGLLNENQAIVEAGLTEDHEVFMSLPENSDEVPLMSLSGDLQEAIAEER